MDECAWVRVMSMFGGSGRVLWTELDGRSVSAVGIG